MKQAKTGVKWSLSSKLLASVAAILALVVGFLTISSVVLLKRDKVAYVYDAQATACALAGREFSAYVQASLDLVHHSLLLVDPFKLAPPEPVPANPLAHLANANVINPAVLAEAQRQIQSILDNQSVSLAASVGKYHASSGEFIPVVKAVRADAMRSAGLLDSDVALSQATIKAYQETLASQGSAFINISQLGKPPLLAVVLLDRKAQAGTESGLAYSVVSLQSFQSGMPASVGALSIYNAQGDVLFNSDSTILFGNSMVRGREAQPSANSPGSASDPILTDARASKTIAGAKEIVIGGIPYLASYYRPGLDLVVSTRTETHQAMRATYTLIEKLVFFGILAIALAVIFALIFAKSLTRPLEQIAAATQEVGQGNFDFNLKVTSQDEVGALARAVNTMSKKIGELVKRMADQARMEQELAVASTVQANLFPLPTYGDHQIRLKGYYRSASECGGDWWGHFRIGNRIAIVIADATGHGIPSALMTAAIRGSFSTIHKLFRSRPDLLKLTPREIIPLANAAVFESGRSGINMTFFIGIIDFETKTMTYANAAHCPPWYVQAQPGKPPKAKMLMSAGPRLGEGPEITEIQEHTLKLTPGDMLVFYTDGLLEGKNPEGVMYGKKRSRKIVETNFGRGEEQMINAIVKDFLAFNGDKSLDDDLTLVAAQLTPEAFKF